MPRYLTLLLIIFFSQATRSADRLTDAPFATRSEVIAPKAMAATSQPLATQIALDVMKQGGNAIDAAIAANAAIGLMEPTGNGIGGDLFAIVWDSKTQKLYGLNGSGRSPKNFSYAQMKQALDKLGVDKIPSHGALPVSVPGTIDAWFELHKKFGQLPMKKVLTPAIDYAQNGFPVSDVIAYYWQRSTPLLSKYPGFKEHFTVAGKAPQKGDVWKNPALAKTLSTIANKGRDGFYKGPIAQTMVDYLKAQGGHFELHDFAEHRSEWVQPVSTNYRGYDVWELPPNTQGIAALQTLNLLEKYTFAPSDFGSERHVHLLVESIKLAFADRAALYADMAFYQTPVEILISKPYADQRRELINEQRAMKKVSAGPAVLQEGDTIYLTTADAQGNMVSLIQSNYRGMGSGMTPPGLGFIFQDRGELFSMEAGHANVYAPGKRPFQTIIPAFITKDGKPWVSFGLMGGGMQPQGHVQIVMNLIDFGMNLQEAGDAPRVYWESIQEPTGGTMNDGGTVYLESGYAWAAIRALMQKGHQVQWNMGGYGGYQAIQKAPNGVYFGASESRKDGQAAGY